MIMADIESAHIESTKRVSNYFPYRYGPIHK